MKKLFYCFVLLVSMIMFERGISQTTLLNLNFNDTTVLTNSGNILWISSYDFPSNGYPNASGSKNMHSQSGSGNAIATYAFDFSTLGYDNIQVIWGAQKEAGQGNITFEWRVGTGSWNVVSFQDISSFNQWGLVNNGNNIPIPGASQSSNVQFRWTLTNPVSYRMDDFKVFGTFNPGPATKLAVLNISGVDCEVLKKNKPFKITVQSQDANGIPSNVTQNTGLFVERISGTGNISGIIYGQINSNTNTATISGLMYDVAEGNVTFKVSRYLGQMLSPGISNPVFFSENAIELGFRPFQISGYTYTFFNIAVYGKMPNGLSDSCFNGEITLSKYSGPDGGLQGTLTKSSNEYLGNCFFDDIYFKYPGTYKIQAYSPGLTIVISGEIIIQPGIPSAYSSLTPQYIQGSNGTNNSRMPYVFFAELKNLSPFSTYRYFNQAVSLNDPNTFEGVGNVIYPNSTSNFIRTTTPGLSTSGCYSEFTTDYLGRYNGWFILEPTADTRFTPGYEIKMRINLNDGIGGNTVLHRLTSPVKVKVINYGASSSNGGFPLFETNASSNLTPKNIILFYREPIDTNVSRSLVSVTIIEADGLNLSSVTEYFTPYRTFIDEQNKCYGAIIPSGLPFGIVRIEERSLFGGNKNSYNPGSLISYATSSNGIWPPGVDTKNLPSGITPIVIHPVFTPVGIISENEIVPVKYTCSKTIRIHLIL